MKVQHRVAHLGEVAALVGREPLAIVVLPQVAQEIEERGGDRLRCHGLVSVRWAGKATAASQRDSLCRTDDA